VAASERFASAIAAFQAANYGQADGLLESFAREFASDARAEDASFLRAVAHSRMGDPSGAASLASAYLRSFPRGLRRREAEELAHTSAIVHAP
jgi:TolA-binding protein